MDGRKMEEEAIKNKGLARSKSSSNPIPHQERMKKPLESSDRLEEEKEDAEDEEYTCVVPLSGAPTRLPRKGSRIISRKLSLELLKCTTKRTVDDWVKKVEKEVGGVKWTIVGGKGDNVPLMNLCLDEISPLVERVTNAMDSVICNFLETEIIHGRIQDHRKPHDPSLTQLPRSPAEAAAMLLGIPMEHEEDPMEKPEAMKDWIERHFPRFLRNFPKNDTISTKKFADALPKDQEIYSKRIFRENFGNVANMIRVSTHDGSKKETPTVVVRDYGGGQKPDNFEKTILEILGGNKHNLWTHGRHGVGSCASYYYSSRTIIISRSEDDEVGVSIVKRIANNLVGDLSKKDTKEDKEEDKEKGSAFYMTDKDGQILRLDLGPEFPNGTEIRMVDYRLGKNISCITERTNSLRQAFNARFMKPTLPFLVEEHRTGMLSGKRMTIRGFLHSIKNKLSAARIKSHEATDDRVCIHNPPPDTINLFDRGSVKARLIVLNSKAKKKYYMMPEQQICFSLNGQRHHSISRNWFREIGFPNLYQDMHLVVDCEGIPYEDQEELFSANRNIAKSGDLLDAIMGGLKTLLLDDNRLLDLEEESKIQKIGLSKTKVSEGVIDEIKRIISDKIDGTVQKPRKPPSGKKRDTDDSELPEVPTTLKVDKNPFRVSRGCRGRLYVNIDAKNGYLPMYGREIKITLPDEVAKKTSVSGLVGGKMMFGIMVPDDAPLGNHEFEVVLEDKINDIKLSDKAKIAITKPSERDEKENRKDKASPEVEVQWIDNQEWYKWTQASDDGEKPWDETSVGECQRNSSGSLTFVLNRNNAMLDHCAATGEFTEASWVSFLNRYTVSITTALYDMIKDESSCSNNRIQSEKERLVKLFVATTRPELMHGLEKHSIPKMETA